MLDAGDWGAVPRRLLRVNRARTQIGLMLKFTSNAIHKSGKEIFGMWKPSTFNMPGWNERANELNAQYREAVSHWNIAGLPKSDPLADPKCRARATLGHEIKFFRENEDQLRSQSMLVKLRRGEFNDF